MSKAKKILKVCPKGHKFFKSSDCLTCPKCESEKKPASGFLSMLASPARRAMEHNNITTLNKLTAYTERDISSLHGIGPNAVSRLKAILKKENLSFKQN